MVDDGCPEETGSYVESKVKDDRIEVIFNKQNLGVGGAVKNGYLRAMELGAGVVIKLDADDQMDPSLIPQLVLPILEGRADYTKGNRFFNLKHLRAMPIERKIGNLILSFFAKFSTGYWRIFDPNNGFTAISSVAIKHIDIEKVDNRYFFESDMLFRLNVSRAVVVDVPMNAIYGSETSHLKIWKVLFEFPFKHARNFTKRIGYTYYLRDFTLASLELPVGLLLTLFGTFSAVFNFIHSNELNQATPTGTLILISMSILVGVQLVLSFFSYDIDSSPSEPITKFR